MTNRYGLTFVENQSPTLYHSGRRWRDYYTLACRRCGWSFKPPSHLRHRMSDCDAVRRMRREDRCADVHCRRNLGKPVPTGYPQAEVNHA